MSETPVFGPSRACPRCGSLTVFEHPQRSTTVDWNGFPVEPESLGAWRCDTCRHVEPWHRHREELKRTIESLRASAAELVGLLPYTAARARAIVRVIAAQRVTAKAQVRQPDAVPTDVSDSLVLRFGEMLDSCDVLARADFVDHDAIRIAAATLLDRTREVERLLSAGDLRQAGSRIAVDGSKSI
jgi:hypothetical protein